MDAALAAAATLVAVGFSLSTLDRWLRRRRPHDQAWSVSLALFAVGAGALWWAETRGWSLATFRIFYLAGAVLNVPWLALGTVYLLAGKGVGDRVRWWLVLLSGLSAGIVLFAPTRAGVSGKDLPTGKVVFGVAPRVLAAVGSGLAAMVIVVGALWSVYRLARHREPARAGVRRVASSAGQLVVGNLLIALGTLVLSASGTVAGRLGKDTAFALTLLIGIAVLFAGFLVASAGRRQPVVALHQRAA
jgi:cytochrome bd-type quinol oxidase subunit 2